MKNTKSLSILSSSFLTIRNPLLNKQLPRLLLASLLLICILLPKLSLATEHLPELELVGEKLEYLVDETHRLNITDVLQGSEDAWQLNRQVVPSFGFSPHTYWFRFNVPKSDSDWLLELNYALLDEVTLYHLSSEGLLDTVYTGDHMVFSERPILHRAFLFPIPASEQTQQIVLKVRSSSAIQLPMTLWPEQSYFEHDQLRFAEHGLYYGIVFVMALYNFFLFLRLRDSAYAFYVLYVITFALTQMSLTGFAYQFIWPELPEWNERSLGVMTPLIVTSGMVFVANFLKLQGNYPSLNRIVYAQAWLGIVVAFLSTFLSYATMIRFGAALAIITCISILLISYYVTIISRQKYAIYFSAAWSAFLIGTVVLAMNKFGLLPRNFATESAAQIGSAIEIILLSFALAERLHDATNRRFMAEAETRKIGETLLETQRTQNEALEVEVEQRTRDLSLALEKVNKLNNELEDLSTMDQVTGIRNRRYFDEMLEREFRRGWRNKRELSLIMIDLDHFKSVNDTYGHQSGDQCLKVVSTEIYRLVKRPPDLACRYGGEELAVVLPETKLDGAQILADRIRTHIEALWIETSEGRIQVTASIGVSACLPSAETSTSGLIEQTDQALYRAKEKGRNRVECSRML